MKHDFPILDSISDEDREKLKPGVLLFIEHIFFAAKEQYIAAVTEQRTDFHINWEEAFNSGFISYNDITEEAVGERYKDADKSILFCLALETMGDLTELEQRIFAVISQANITHNQGSSGDA